MIKALIFSFWNCWFSRWLNVIVLKLGKVEGSEKANHTLVLTPVIVLEWCLWGIGWPLLENSWKFLVAQLAVGLLSLTASWLRFKPIKGCGMELWQWSTFIMIDRDLKLSWLWFTSKCSLLRIFVFAQKDQHWTFTDSLNCIWPNTLTKPNQTRKTKETRRNHWNKVYLSFW